MWLFLSPYECCYHSGSFMKRYIFLLICRSLYTVWAKHFKHKMAVSFVLSFLYQSLDTMEFLLFQVFWHPVIELFACPLFSPSHWEFISQWAKITLLLAYWLALVQRRAGWGWVGESQLSISSVSQNNLNISKPCTWWKASLLWFLKFLAIG